MRRLFRKTVSVIMLTLLLMTSLLSMNASIGIAPPTQWSKTYGGANNDIALSVVQTGDGGYALAGHTYSFGGGTYSDFWLVKTDSAGTMLWNKTYGGKYYDDAYSVVQTGDGGYALAGSTEPFDAGGYYAWLVKVAPEVHDVAVPSVTSSKTVVDQGYSTSINITVENQGDYTETFNVTAYANTTIITKLTDITLTSGSSTTVTFIWNTAGFAKGNYTIGAYAWPVLSETDFDDNNRTNGWILITKVGDLGSGGGFFKCDGLVDGFDLTLFIQAYNEVAPPEAMYLADLGSAAGFFIVDEKVDGFDLTLFIQCYNGLGPDP